MERDDNGDPNSFLKNYFRLVAGFTGAPRVDDRLHDLSTFVQQTGGANSSLNCGSIKSENRSDLSAFGSANFQITNPHRQKVLSSTSALESTPMEYFASPNQQPQRRHSMHESISHKSSSSSSSILSCTLPHSSSSSSPFPPYLTAAQLCRSMWDDVKHRTLRCGICTKNITATECSVILQHARSHCEFESFECLLCYGSSTNLPPYRTNKYQVMYGHMKSAHKGRMIMNETWRRLRPEEIAKVDEQLVATAAPRASIHDDPEEDRKIRDIIYQCFNEWINVERIWERISAVLTDETPTVGERRDNGSYYNLNDKTVGSFRGTGSLALPLASASSYGIYSPGTTDSSARGQSPFPYPRNLSSQYVQRPSAAITMPVRRTSSEESSELRQNMHKDDRSTLDTLLKIQQSKKIDLAELSGVTSAVEMVKHMTGSPAPSSLFFSKQNRARKRVSGGSRSLPALETINQLCQQLRNEASYYDGEQRTLGAGGGGGQEGSTTAGERRPRIWCHLCNKAIELPEAASRYMTEHVSSAHTTLKLFCCATCPYEAKTYTQVKAHIKNHHPACATATTTNGAGIDEKCVSLRDTFTVKEETMIPLLKACFMPQRTGVGMAAATGDTKNGPERPVGAYYRSAFTSAPVLSGRTRMRKGIPRKKSNGIYKCRRCCFTSTSSEELQRHRRTTWCAYTWLVVHACPYCNGFTTRFSNVLEKHIARVHMNNDRASSSQFC